MSRTRPSGPSAGRRRSWAVPLQVHQTVASGASRESKVLLDTDEMLVPLLDPEAVVVVNHGGHGFYRVAYDAALRERLTEAAAQGLSTVERYALVDDAWAAVVAGEASADRLLRARPRLRRRARRRRVANARRRARLVRPAARRRRSGALPDLRPRPRGTSARGPRLASRAG